MLKNNFSKYINDNFQKFNLNRPYYFFNNVTNIKSVNTNFFSINKISYKNVDDVVYNIIYIIMESINNQSIDSEKSSLSCF